MADKVIASGAWVQVRIFVDGLWRAIGLATGCSYNEDYGIQPANVLNHLGPISYDSQNYTCSIQLSTFVPERKALLGILADNGEITIEDLLPTRDSIQAEGKGKTFDGLAFVNTATNETLREFSEVILASNGEQVQPNQYVSEDVRFMAVKRTK
jgi:hypothetical protein